MNYRAPLLLVDEDFWCVAVRGIEICLKQVVVARITFKVF